MLALLAISCGTDSDPVSSDGPVAIDVWYQDSSVAPEYHRSYSIAVAQGEADIEVNSYGTVVAATTIPIDASTVDEVLTRAATMGNRTERSACGGGNEVGFEITTEDDDRTLQRVVADSCSDTGSDLQDDVFAALRPLLDAVDIATLTKI